MKTRGAISGITGACLLTTIGVLGCGGTAANADGSNDATSSGGNVSCTVSQSDGTRTYSVLCIEGSAALRPTVEAACTGPDAGPSGNGVTNTGHFAQTPCSHEGAAGGCRITFGGNSQTSWYYTGGGFTAAQVQQVCDGTGTFVTP